MILRKRVLVALLGTCLGWQPISIRGTETSLDLTHAVVVAPSTLSRPESKAVSLLIEEIEKRTQIRLTRSSSPPNESKPSIQIRRAATPTVVPEPTTLFVVIGIVVVSVCPGTRWNVIARLEANHK